MLTSMKVNQRYKLSGVALLVQSSVMQSIS